MAYTLGDLYKTAIGHNKPDAILTKDTGSYAPISSSELERRVIKVHSALRSAGLRKGTACAMIAENRWEWAVADFAMMTGGIVSVPIYPTLPAEQVRYLLNHSECSVIFCSTAEQVDKVLEVRDRIPRLAQIISFDEDSREGVTNFSSMIGDGDPDDAERDSFNSVIDSIQPEDLASIIYTSGTTGVPKGVMLSHANIAINVSVAPISVGPTDIGLSFLPLCHVAERLADYVYFKNGATVAYAESIEAVPVNMNEVRPTIAVGVPRFFEKVYGRVMAAMEQAPAVRRFLFDWAVGIGHAANPYKLAGKPLPGLLRIRHGLADKLVFQKLRGRLGGRVRMFISGAAPLARHLAEFFYALGLPIYEGYGLTETSPLVSINTTEDMKFGSVGKIISDVEVRIASDGEILVKGPNVMQGYFKMDEQTAEVMDGDWFHTGDIGNLDDEGFLSITDRKKDLFKTSGGKYIAPAPIEGHLKKSTLIETAVVIAEQRNFPSALIVPDFAALEAWASGEGIEYSGNEELCANAQVHARVMGEVEELCGDMARFEQIKKIALVPNDFSIDGGELTPTMKVRRSEVNSKYAQEIEALYA